MALSNNLTDNLSALATIAMLREETRLMQLRCWPMSIVFNLSNFCTVAKGRSVQSIRCYHCHHMVRLSIDIQYAEWSFFHDRAIEIEGCFYARSASLFNLPQWPTCPWNLASFVLRSCALLSLDQYTFCEQKSLSWFDHKFQWSSSCVLCATVIHRLSDADLQSLHNLSRLGYAGVH